MRLLVDPSAISLGPASWLFLAVLCVLLPAGAIRQHRLLYGQTLTIGRTRIYASGLVTHGLLLVLVWLVVREQQLSVFPAYRPTAWHLAVGLLSLAMGVLPFVRSNRDDRVARERTRLIAPRTRTEFGAFYLLAVSAGFTEQLAYRGILFTLLFAIGGSWWTAAVGGAVFFGIAHLFQGWKSAGIASGIGLRDHLVVGLTGTLWIAIVVHILHDAIAGTVIGRRLDGEQQPEVPVMPEPSPPEVTPAIP
jgi:membrane protease YdiL (CAAX protease family)